MFRGRLMWPIRDLTGETVAFGARKLNADDDGPKYLNTPETAVFKKSHLLYGADLAKREIAQAPPGGDRRGLHRRDGLPPVGRADRGRDLRHVLRRGPREDPAAADHGHRRVDRRDRLHLRRRRGRAEGRAAGVRLEEKFVTQTYVAVQPDGLDPCDLRVKHGDAAVRDLVARRVPLFEFAIRSVLAKHDLDTREGQFAAIDEAAPIIVRIKDRAKWKQYAVDLDRWIGFMDERYVLDRVRQAAAAMQPKRGAPARSNPNEAAPESGPQRQGNPRQAQTGRAFDRSDPVHRVEREALKLAVQWSGLTGPEFDALGASRSRCPPTRPCSS